MDDARRTRVTVYVDGSNLFFGMRDSKQRRYYWLNLETLVTQFIQNPLYRVQEIKYFTAPVKGDEAKHERQSRYLDALSTCPLVKIYRGSYLQEPFYCSNCHNRRPVWKEKQTDTMIATEFVADAFLNRWDVAYLISADSDLVPPLQIVKTHFQGKHVIIGFPPGRSSGELRNLFGSTFWINETMLKHSQFAEDIAINGKVVSRPEDWT